MARIAGSIDPKPCAMLCLYRVAMCGSFKGRKQPLFVFRSAGALGVALCLACGVGAGPVACSLVLTADGLQGGEPDAGYPLDSSSEDAPIDIDEPEAVEEAQTASCDPCADPSLARLPCRPNVEDSASGPPVAYATRTMRLGFSSSASDDWQFLGLDRDCMYTTALGEPSMCVLPSAERGKDGLNGRDNSFGLNFGQLARLLKTLGYLATDLEVAVNQDIERGFDGWTIGLEEFNHAPNDPRVTVVLRFSEGTTTETGEKVDARWDGTDLWSIDPTSLSSTGHPLFVDDNAFVVDGVLVARMPEGVPFSVQADQGSLVIHVNEIVVAARLSDDHVRIEEGTVSGVWPLALAIDQTVEFATRFGLCPPNPLIETVRSTMEQAADIRSDLVSAPTADCNGLSFGMAFTGQAAQLGPIAPAKPPQPDACADAGSGEASVADADAIDAD